MCLCKCNILIFAMSRIVYLNFLCYKHLCYHHSLQIRHRGSFMKTFSILTLLFITIMCLLIMTLAKIIPNDDSCISISESIVGNSISNFIVKYTLIGENAIGQEGTFLQLFIWGLLLIELGGMDCAKFDDMQNDVLTALAWLKSNEDLIGLKCSSSTKSGEQQVGGNKSTMSNKHQSRFIFGGYSSGGHVASVVCQNPTLWKEHNLPPPHIHCDSLLFISPVLSTKSYHDLLLKKVSSLSSASSASLPSLSSSDTGSSSASEHNLSRQSSLATTDVSSLTSTLSTSKSPTWLTDQVVKGVFGSASSTVPSPIHTYEKSPSIPHVFVGCRNEMFGINWLDIFFASPHYSELLNSMGIESRYTAINSDHWNILNSKVLSDCLRMELDRA